jgi:ADP-heptose:LPS heptosyltransferase
MLPSADCVPGVRKIAVLRANALGDFIFTLPALEALRAAYPGAEIVLLGKQFHHDFLLGRPGPVDRVEVVPPYPGVTAEEGEEVDRERIDAFFQRMQAERFDLALQLHGGGASSNPFTRRLGARVTAGLQDRGAPPLDRNVPYIYFQREQLRYLEVAGTVGAPPVPIEPRLIVTDADRAEAMEVLPPTERPLAVLHPGVGAIDRRWPEEKFAAVADALHQAGAEIAVTGTEEEREIVDAVARRACGPVHALAGQLTLSGLTGLLERAAVVVANDTGPHHLAAAVGTATVGIYWCFNIINADPTSRTIHRPIVSWQLECPLCGRSQVTDPCTHKVSYVADVSVELVVEHALDLLRLARDW